MFMVNILVVINVIIIDDVIYDVEDDNIEFL